MQKKENEKIKDEIQKYKKIIDEQDKDEEQIDIQTFIQDMDNQNIGDNRNSKMNTQKSDNKKVYS